MIHEGSPKHLDPVIDYLKIIDMKNVLYTENSINDTNLVKLTKDDIKKYKKKNNYWYREQFRILGEEITSLDNIVDKQFDKNLIDQFINYKPGEKDEKYMELTLEALKKGKNPNYRTKQLQILGIENPPAKDWKLRVIGNLFTIDTIERFINYKISKKLDDFFPVTTVNKKTEFIPDITVYTDGACSNNGRSNAEAGIGIYFGDNDSRNVSRRIDGKQSNNTAELGAILEVFTILKDKLDKGARVLVVTDSKYAQRCFQEYGIKCNNNKWKNNIPNIELVKQAYMYGNKYKNVEFLHVKAHTNGTDKHSIGNDHADRLANSSIGL